MFGTNWLISVRFIGTTNLGGMFANISRQSFVAQKSIYGLNSDISGLRKVMDGLRASSLNLGTALSGGFAAGGFAAMGTAVADAAKLQQILLSIKNETGATNSQIGSFYNTAFKIANDNAMTPAQGGEVLRSISRLTAGKFNVAQMMAVAPTVADFASKVHFNRPDISIDAATKTGIQTAHLFRAYEIAPLTKLLDSVYRLSGLMSESPDQALRQMSYYEPMFKALGVSNDTSIATMALLDRAGFRNKVGTNVRAEVLEALGPLQVSKHAQAGKKSILEQMGLLDKNGRFAWNNKDGTLNYFGELSSITKWATAERKKGMPASTIVAEMFGALGKQGGTVASLFLDQQMPGILKGLQDYLKDGNVGLAAASKNRDQGLNFQFGRAVSNLNAVMTELGYPWLRDITTFFKGVGDNLHGLQAWLHGHRNAEKQIGEVVAGFTSLMGIRFAVGTATLLVGAARALGLIGAAAPGIGLAARAFTMLDGIFLAGMGGRVLSIATKFGVLSGATSAFAAVMGGSAVAGVPAAFRALSMSLLGLAGPIAVATAAIAGLLLLATKSTSSEDSTVRAGGNAKRYGTKGWWEKFGAIHGWQAVPSDVRQQLHTMHASDAAHRAAALASVRGTHMERTREVHHHHTTFAPVITVNGGKDDRKTGQVVGSVIRHELSKAGLIRNNPLGAGFQSAVPAHH